MLYQVGVATKIYEEINHYQYIATEKKYKTKETGVLSITTIKFMWFYHQLGQVSIVFRVMWNSLHLWLLTW